MGPGDFWGDDEYRGADRTYNNLPDWVRDQIEDPEDPDQRFKELFDDLFSIENGRVNWDDSKAAHDSLQSWMWNEYGIDLDDYFEWEQWRENYDDHAA
jgi:hypothetical protein